MTAADPVGVNIFDVIFSEWKLPVREAFAWAIDNPGKKTKIAYEFEMAGQVRFKKGLVTAKNGKLFLRVARFARPEQAKTPLIKKQNGGG